MNHRLQRQNLCSRLYLEISVANAVSMEVLKGEGDLAAVDPRGLFIHLDRVAPEELKQVRTGQKVEAVVQKVPSSPRAAERHDERVLPQDPQNLALV